MAQIKYGALASEIRGSIGGTSFQANRYGFTIKNKSNQVKPATTSQNRSKFFLNGAVKAWGLLDNSDRLAWNNFAQDYPQPAHRNPDAILNGFNAFVKFHTALYLWNSEYAGFVALPVDPPPIFPFATLELYRDGSDLYMSFSWSATGDTYYTNVFMSKRIPASQSFVGSRYRWIAGTQNHNGTLFVAIPYLSIFGYLPVIGDKVSVALQLFPVFGGKVSAPQVFSLIVQEA